MRSIKLVFKAIAALVVAASFAPFSMAGNDRSVTWAIEAFEPFYIQSGEYVGQGTADNLIDLLVAQLPGYQHERKPMPILRIVEELRKGAQVICISFLHDETLLGFSQYTDPVFVVPPQEVIMRRDSWENEFDRKTPLALKKLLHSGRYKLGLSAGRNFGEMLNPILAKYASAHPTEIYIRSGDHFKGLAKMLERGRIDLTIAYSGESKYFSQLKGSIGDLVSVPILENSQALKVYAVLPRTPWGDEILSEFNNALVQVKNSESYRASMTDWFDSTPEFERLLQSILP